MHRDEATADQLAATAKLPAIVAHDGERWSEALSMADIEACAGSPQLLLDRIAQE